MRTRSSGLTAFVGPDPSWRNVGDCGTVRYSVQKHRVLADTEPDESDQLPVNCGGPSHVNIRDVDGSLLGNGAGSTLLGGILPRSNNSRLFPYDQATPLVLGPCKRFVDGPYTAAYVCTPGKSGWAWIALPAVKSCGNDLARIVLLCAC